jgi:hypothetical protein
VASNLLQADTVGSRVPRMHRSGRVEAVFGNACNVALDAGGLVTLLAARAGNVAHGIRLSHAMQFESSLRCGMPVRVEEDCIEFDAGAVEVKLAGARTWTSAFRPGRCQWNPCSIRAAARVRDLLGREAKMRRSEFLAAVLGMEGPATPLAARIAEVLPALASCTRAGDRAGALRQVARLVGLGPGLTPSGDDFIIGWLAGLVLRADAPPQLRFLQDLCAGIESLASATTSVSRQHLADACALAFSERLSNLCLAIGDAAPAPRLASAAAAQIAVGASSGADAAAGLMFTLFNCAPAGPPAG